MEASLLEYGRYSYKATKRCTIKSLYDIFCLCVPFLLCMSVCVIDYFIRSALVSLFLFSFSFKVFFTLVLPLCSNYLVFR